MKIFIPVIPMIIGFILDFFIGDPYSLPHPIRLIGRLIAFLEKKVRDHFNDLLIGGRVLSLTVILLFTIIPFLMIFISYKIDLILGLIIESIFCFYLIAARCLCRESKKVYDAVKINDTEGARKAVSMIVGRDTDRLDEEGIIKAAVETVAENTSDGVIAPMIFTAIGGPVLGFLYKAVNTMDSMIGYKNDKFLYFGRAAAKLDDFVNFIPARISAYLMILAAFLGGKDFNGKKAKEIFKRDRFNHASPNSAQTESVCAGALGVKLAGDASYFGKVVKKPFIGDADRSIERDDIKRACRLMYITAFLCMVICTLILLAVWEVCFFVIGF